VRAALLATPGPAAQSAAGETDAGALGYQRQRSMSPLYTIHVINAPAAPVQVAQTVHRSSFRPWYPARLGGGMLHAAGGVLQFEEWTLPAIDCVPQYLWTLHLYRHALVLLPRGAPPEAREAVETAAAACSSLRTLCVLEPGTEEQPTRTTLAGGCALLVLRPAGGGGGGGGGGEDMRRGLMQYMDFLYLEERQAVVLQQPTSRRRRPDAAPLVEASFSFVESVTRALAHWWTASEPTEAEAVRPRLSDIEWECM